MKWKRRSAAIFIRVIFVVLFIAVLVLVVGVVVVVMMLMGMGRFVWSWWRSRRKWFAGSRTLQKLTCPQNPVTHIESICETACNNKSIEYMFLHAPSYLFWCN